MNKREFNRGIRKAKKYLLDRSTSDGYGVCFSLFYGFERDLSIPEEFQQLFAPRLKNNTTYWLGARNRKNLDKRLFYLEMFEGYMLSSGEYKKLGRKTAIW